jgi:hypothetical protein
VQNLLSYNLLWKYINIKVYRTIIFPVVLYGCEIWSLKLREELKLSVFENRVLRGIFGPNRDEVTGEWITLDKQEFMLCTHHQFMLCTHHQISFV